MNKKILKKIVLQEIKSLLKEQPSAGDQLSAIGKEASGEKGGEKGGEKAEKSDPKDVERYKIAKTKGVLPSASKKINTRDEAVAVAMDDIRGDIENVPASTQKQVITMLIQKLKKQLSGQ
jgi:hypothetical protein